MSGIAFECLETNLKTLFLSVHFLTFICFLSVAVCFDFATVCGISTRFYSFTNCFCSFLLAYQSFLLVSTCLSFTSRFYRLPVVFTRFYSFTRRFHSFTSLVFRQEPYATSKINSLFYNWPIYKQLALGWQITKQLSGLNPP